MSWNGISGVEPPELDSAHGTGIFLSYRRGDPGAPVGRLYDRLVSRFGRERVFRDIDSAVPAANFELAIDRALFESSVLVAVIGPNWLTVTNAAGQRRLDAPKDYVRYEVARALENPECKVLPILRGARTMMPSADDLPEELRSLVTLQAIRVDEDDDGPHFEFDAQQVVNAVARILGEPSSRLDPDIVLGPPDLVVEPGHAGQIAVVARNIGSDSANAVLSYDGPEWARLGSDVESVAAGRELRSALTVNPPRNPDVPARAWPYTIALNDPRRELPLAQANGTITTVAFRDTQVRLEPTSVELGHSSPLSLTVANGGNVHLYGRMSARADGLNAEIQDRIALEPGAEQTVPVELSGPKRRLVGRSRDHSLTVSVEVDEEPHPHVRKATVRRRPVLRTTPAILLVALLAVLIGAGIWSAREAEATLPDVTGLVESAAAEELKAAGFNKLRTVPVESDQPAGQVIRTEPASDDEISRDETVLVYVSTGKSGEIPLLNVTDLTGTDAEAALKAAGLAPTLIEEESTAEEPGEVLRTEPAPGTPVAPGDAIKVFVVKAAPVETPAPPPTEPPNGGPHKYEIPNVRDLTYEQARERIPEQLSTSEEEEYSNEVAEGLVIRTDPEIGTSQPAGTEVEIVVSLGPQKPPTEVPNVIGMDEGSAATALEAAGFDVSMQETVTCPGGNVVIDQDPGGGTPADPGTTVVIVVAVEPSEGCIG